MKKYGGFNRRSALSMVLFFLPLISSAQSIPVNFAVWPGFELFMPLSEDSKWGLFAEGYLKRVNFLKDPQGVFWRLGGTYYLPNGNRISAGIAEQYNYPYDDAALPYNWTDWRIWQQYIIRKSDKKHKNQFWVHRFRFEERWFGRKSDPTMEGFDSYKFEVTFRYLIRTQWFLSPKFGVAVYDEFHFRIYSQERNEKLFDQNRIYGGLIFPLDVKREWRLETGYMLQTQWESPENIPGKERINNTWRITITGDVPLKKKK